MNQNIHSQKHLKNYRKELRNNLTYSEARLWSLLRKRQLLGRKFRRQHSIGNYIVDFFCYEEGLVVELDGSSHNNPGSQQYDSIRDEYLKSNGFKIIRIDAVDVINNFQGVLSDIKAQFAKTEN